MKKYTQGEWVATHYKDFESTIKTKDGVRIAEAKSFGGDGIFRDATEAERIYNAKLIASAPEMLDGLQECLNYFETNGKGNSVIAESLKLLIKKATT